MDRRHAATSQTIAGTAASGAPGPLDTHHRALADAHHVPYHAFAVGVMHPGDRADPAQLAVGVDGAAILGIRAGPRTDPFVGGRPWVPIPTADGPVPARLAYPAPGTQPLRRAVR